MDCEGKSIAQFRILSFYLKWAQKDKGLLIDQKAPGMDFSVLKKRALTRLLSRQMQGEGAALSEFAFYGNGSTVGLGDVFDDGQP